MNKAIALMPLLVLVSCGGEGIRTRGLREIDGYIQSRPDSALAVLNSMDADRFRSRRGKAEYSLLKAMALDKNYVDTSDLSVIAPAADYYETRGGGKERMEMLYYRGRIHENAGDLPNAILDFKRALDCAPEEEYRYKGMICSGLSSLHNLSFNNTEELEYDKLAYEFYLKSNDSSAIEYSLTSLAVAYHNNRQFAIADSLYSLPLSDSLSESALKRKILQAHNIVTSPEPNYPRAVSIYESVIENNARLLTVHDYYEYSYALLESSKYQDADAVLSSLSGHPDEDRLYYLRSKIEADLGHFGTAIQYRDRYEDYSNEIIETKLKQSIFKAQTNYYEQASQLSEARVRILHQRNLLTLLSGTVLLIALVSGGIVFYRRRKREAEAERERLLSSVEESRRLVGEMEQKVYDTESIRKMYVGTYRNQFRKIGYLFDESSLGRRETISELAKKELAENLEELLSEISSKSEGQALLEKRINKDVDGIVAKLRSDFPKFDDEDIRLLCYMIIGFDGSTISFLMGSSKAAIYNREHRVRKRISEYDGPNRGFYEMFFFTKTYRAF